MWVVGQNFWQEYLILEKLTLSVEGSAAAAWQASIGSVAAGTLFATLQSAAATGSALAWGAGIGGAIAMAF
ncbi:hypothetical protein L211DRAFT_836082 [Terfezia boudieri ATCC MYA-4762]|uniref:Uncharacterized protein n=1 Tax=Terfezia boudieri ATCC MYA-4762 TaxID=1051890 RepID=A0A3N4LSV8_9PEZI|nr:hypothetical protein L211DRAFT_836082 [Terfezia boudieri ATCC MYA-4762]